MQSLLQDCISRKRERQTDIGRERERETDIEREREEGEKETDSMTERLCRLRGTVIEVAYNINEFKHTERESLQRERERDTDRERERERERDRHKRERDRERERDRDTTQMHIPSLY
jgi:hypothetical protein